MSKKFIEPDFSSGGIELRYENGEVCIYGDAKGLKKMSDFCLELIEKQKLDHIHLEDYEILTNNSLVGVIAFFQSIKK